MTGHDHNPSHESAGNLKVAFLLNLTFTVVEIIGGVLTNSIAILADAVHDLGDTASLGLAWYFDRLSQKGRTPQHTYGFRRYRLVGGFITGCMLFAGLGFVLWNAVPRLLAPEPVHAPGMIVLAIIGIAVNGAAVMRVRKGTSLTEQIVSWHLIEDTLGWAAVFVGATIMTIWDLPIVDPLLSIGISGLILWNVGKSLKKILRVFLQLTPDTFSLESFEGSISSIPKVISSHHTHSWSLDGETHVLSTHLVMESSTNRDDILHAKQQLHERLGCHDFKHITIEVELSGEPCRASPEE